MGFLIAVAKFIIPKKYHSICGALYREILSNIFALLFIGNKFVCPCCGWRFRKFLTYGVKQRRNAMCPRCRSMERHRLLWLFLKNRTNLFHDKLKVLHVSPEYFFQKTFKSMSNLDYISADLNSPYAMIRMDVTNILYEGNYFDVILCSHVLEHVIDDKKAMMEFFRVLKPGGWAILQVPVFTDREHTFEDPQIKTPEEREIAFGQKDHVRIYGLDYRERLEEAGFEVNVDDYVKGLSLEMVREFSLNRDENIYICTKPQC